MGRKYYYPKRKYRHRGGGLAGLLSTLLGGGRSRGHYAPRPSLKQTLLRAVLKRLLRKFF